jgi:hypothetical protein
MRAGSCYGTPGQPCLDISSVKAKSKRSAFASNAFSTVQREMDRLFKNNTKKYVVWLDAPYTGACGQGHLYQDTRRTSANYNQGRTLAVIYRPYDDDAEGGFCRGRTLLHEMGHNMGAIQQVAPNAYDGAHCDDSVEDVMCYKNDVTPAGAGDTDFGTFDYNNDDYWDPAADPSSGSELTLPWWTVNLSKFICPAAAGCESPKDPTP